uniref:Sulfotransferase n=1 Tax=Ailuropoda melanoleuca TaxID=9646 RepID=G1LGJ9_AILME
LYVNNNGQHNYLLKFKDFYFALSVTNINLLETLEDFEIRDDNVFIVMYPKSGKLFERHLLSLLMAPMKKPNTETFVGGISQSELIPNILFNYSNCFVFLYNDETILTTQAPCNLHFLENRMIGALEAMSYRVVNSLVVHSPFCLPPLSSMTSYFHFSKSLIVLEDFDNMEDFMERFLDGKGNYEFFVNLWFDHIRGWYEHRHDFKILFMMYEEMKKDLRSAVLKISSGFFFFEKELSEEDVDAVVEQATFQNMASDPQINYDYILKDTFTLFVLLSHLFVVLVLIPLCTPGDWKRQLTVEQNGRLDRIFQSKMEDLPLKFIWDLNEE